MPRNLLLEGWQIFRMRAGMQYSIARCLEATVQGRWRLHKCLLVGKLGMTLRKLEVEDR
jgi:hypothetical protein